MKKTTALRLMFKSEFTLISLIAILIYFLVGWYAIINSTPHEYLGKNDELRAMYDIVNKRTLFGGIYIASLMTLGVIALLSINVKRFLNLIR
jgi:hypothetical protein